MACAENPALSSFKTLLSRTNGMYEVMHFDNNNGVEALHTVTHEDLDPILAKVKEINETANWEATRKEPMRHVAVIPQFVLDKAAREGWFNDKAKWTAWANDPVNQCFRTWPGKI